MAAFEQILLDLYIRIVIKCIRIIVPNYIYA